MLSNADLTAQLEHVLVDTDFTWLGPKSSGKVRDSYVRNNKRFLIATDRLSCFDVVVTSIPFKGQVLTELALGWFKETSGIIENHVLDVPDPNVMVVRECAIVPIEVIVRGYLTGSAWRDYSVGRPISGHRLPPGLRMSERLPEALLTPSTKAARGEHDEPISAEEIVRRGIVDAARWQEIEETALALFARGQELAAQRGLLLVDTKYEFGMSGSKLILADEIHTLDSSRYWIAESYAERFARGEAPHMLDKEPTRQWLLDRGYKGDGPVPEFTAEHRVQIARHYIDSFEKIAGTRFTGKTGAVVPRIEQQLKAYCAHG